MGKYGAERVKAQIMIPPYTEKESPPVWQSLYLLKTSKTRFNVSSEYQGRHSDDR